MPHKQVDSQTHTNTHTVVASCQLLRKYVHRQHQGGAGGATATPSHSQIHKLMCEYDHLLFEQNAQMSRLETQSEP